MAKILRDLYTTLGSLIFLALVGGAFEMNDTFETNEKILEARPNHSENKPNTFL